MNDNMGREPEDREYPQVTGDLLPEADHWIGGQADRERVRRHQDRTLFALRWLAVALVILTVVALAVLLVKAPIPPRPANRPTASVSPAPTGTGPITPAGGHS
jgi:hypothetical protein